MDSNSLFFKKMETHLQVLFREYFTGGTLLLFAI